MTKFNFMSLLFIMLIIRNGILLFGMYCCTIYAYKFYKVYSIGYITDMIIITVLNMIYANAISIENITSNKDIVIFIVISALLYKITTGLDIIISVVRYLDENEEFVNNEEE